MRRVGALTWPAVSDSASMACSSALMKWLLNSTRIAVEELRGAGVRMGALSSGQAQLCGVGAPDAGACGGALSCMRRRACMQGAHARMRPAPDILWRQQQRAADEVDLCLRRSAKLLRRGDGVGGLGAARRFVGRVRARC